MRILDLVSRHRRAILLAVMLLLGAALVISAVRSFHAVEQMLREPAQSGGSHWVLRWLDRYGLPLVLGATVVGAAGVPLPTNLLLMTMGAAAAEGQQSAWAVYVVALVGLVAGDHLGYLIGWWGGRWLVRRVARLLGSEEQISRAAERVHRQGWMAVFLTRWLISPLGSPANWVCGSMAFPVRRFLVADVLGEAIYVAMFLLLGMAFSDQIEAIAGAVGTLGLWLVGAILFAAVAVGWRKSTAYEVQSTK